MLKTIIAFAIGLLILSLAGYLLITLKEALNLYRGGVEIVTSRITQRDIDSMDFHSFSLGKTNLLTGDEVKIYLKDNAQVRGIVLGARKKQNTLCVVAKEDELIEFDIAKIQKVKVVSKYGRLW